mgnify:CR=1 FL=1
MRKHKNGLKSGFTLIEILIVVAVIGLLVSLVLIGLAPMQKKGRDTRRLSDLRQAQHGLEIFFNRYGRYPYSGAGCAGGGDCVPACNGTTGGSPADNWNNLVSCLQNSNLGISSVSHDPRNVPANGFVYRYGSPNGSIYVLGAKLEENDNPALAEDNDSPNLYGVDCQDLPDSPIYCLTL